MKPELFGFLDVMIGFGWLILLLLISWFIQIRNIDKEYYRFFVPNVIFKLLFGGVFALTYVVVLNEGGDTIGYWQGAVNLNQLFWESPSAYFTELFSTPTANSITERFNPDTGYPPSWIYKESESFFVSKILSVFTFITFNSYLALTFIFSFIASMASWRFYQLVKDFKFCPQWILIGAALFIPTVAFWCSGISKDTLVLAAMYFLLYHLFALIQKDRQFNLFNFLAVLFHVFLLYNMRPFMLIAIFAPLLIAFLIRFLKSLSDNPVVVFTVRLVLFAGTFALLFSYFGVTNGGEIEDNPYLQEVVIIQRDFAENRLYTGYRYDLGITDYTSTGMIKAAPIAIITAFYRPFLWEANSAFLLLSGLESTLLLFLTLRFFFWNGNFWNHLKFVRSNEFLVFAILFTLLLGFFVGFTSGLFNVLVRFKAPLMALLFIFFASRNPYRNVDRLE